MSSLYEQIYSFILDGIKEGQMKKGDKIPTEKELADQFNVSRITSKKALDMLAEQNIIERFKGKGSFVSSELPSVLEKKDLDSTSEQEELIGLIIPDFTDTYGLELFRAIEKRSSENNYNLVIKRTYGDEDLEKKAINSLVKIGVKGMIIYPVQGVHYNSELIRLVLEKYPLVLVDRYLKGIPASSVSINNKEATKEVTKHLIESGQKHIAFMSPRSEGTSSLEERLMGFYAAFSEKGIPLNPDYLVTEIQSTRPVSIYRECDKDLEETDRQTIEHFISNNPKVSTILCSEFEIAVLLVKILKELGKKVPEDFSVICFDSPPSYMDAPIFTHIKQNQEMMGFKAVDLLVEQLQGNRIPYDCKVDYCLVEGKSTK
ncbi:GntR family transcriptional regulator [Neobacillus novalis]|uniref:GntR family transcriptional regulator n=1 Tax=Neobacillus novalis TaxID=220687 RepID=A0AA95MM36_9BACI|nr:GntR family transcriptional regulator [Neobacillus novalis]WHY86030.1 GntR family transcriptional regulator [Neobacillus novalis]